MGMISTRQPSSAMLRWFTLGAAGGAVVTMALHALGMDGPWLGIALVMALLAAFAALAVFYNIRVRERELAEAQERALRDEQLLGELQRELERHAQLEQELRLAKQAAESAVMAKGEFLATMSHEIRTPLNGIVPMLDLLMHARLAPDHAELVRTAHTSSQQLLRIVDDILDFSKLEADKLELETTAFNLRELLEGVIDLMERPAQSKGLRMHLDIDPGVRLPVRGDPVRLRQVLGNLLSNAVKFTERGSVRVSVRKLGESAAQHQLRFEVRDTGVGISRAGQARLFQAFSQADASTTRLFGGTGLGLAICKRIVELMNGRIGVESEEGQGATFWFEVPLLKIQGDMPVQDQRADGGRLLLLSADPRLRLRLSMLLPNWGLRVTTVETTQEALNRLRSAASQGVPWAYSIVLADLAGMRHTALALHRNLGRKAIYGDIKLVCLYGDGDVPEELSRDTAVISRQAPDADLRAALLGQPRAMPEMPEDVDTGPTVIMPADSPESFSPVATADPPGAPQAAAPEPAEVQPAPPRTPRVLLVEDNPVNLMVGQRLLAMLGITCDTAGNGEAALMRMSASCYDLVLMDCQMPVLDGYTATRQWRESEAAAGGTRHLPIIAMTANAMAGDRQKCLDAGMDDYLPKPVTRSELERCIYHWWNPDQPQRAETEPAAPDAHASMEPEPGVAAAPEPMPEQAPAPAFESGLAVELELQLEPEPDPATTPTPEPAAATIATEVAASTVMHPADASPLGPAPVGAAATRPGEPAAPATASTPAAAVAPGAAHAPAPEEMRSAPRQAPPVIDEAVLEELRSMLGDEVQHLVDVFLEDTPKLLARLEVAASEGDYDGLRDAAHSLKSSSAN